MRYQDHEKGLFTFYREQSDYEEEMTRRKREIKEAAEELSRKATSERFAYQNSRKSTNMKKKVESQPDHLGGQTSIEKKKRMMQQFGQSVIIINRKKTEEEKLIGQTGKLRHFRESSEQRQKGYFLQNKKIEFISPNHKQIKIGSFLGHHRKSYIKRREEQHGQFPHQKMKLPILGRNQENANNSRITKNRALSVLKSNGAELIRLIRSGIDLQQVKAAPQVKRSVSYIQYNRDYIHERDAKKFQQLNNEQKRLLQVLNRYRRSSENQ